MPDDEWKEFNNDPRVKCKYGEKCYQKNPEHHKTYKHPPKSLKEVSNNREKRKFSPFTRKPKVNPTGFTEQESKPVQDKITPTTTGNRNPESSENIVKDSVDWSSTNATERADFQVKIPESVTFYGKEIDPNKLKELFLVDMPPDFFKFYECLNGDNSIEKTLSSVNLELIGPYDFLLGKLPVIDDKELYLVHWRFFYDPPEFQAVLKRKGSSQFHIGYYRDNPDEIPVFVASNDSEKDYRITPVAENIFGAVYLFLQNEKKSSPFTSMACQRVMEKVKKAAETHNFSLKEYTMKKRQTQIVAKTLHGAGIVVPYNKKTKLGYRMLVESDENLKKIFKRLQEATSQSEKDKVLTELQPVITYASIAVDECDFGTGLEAGIDLFCSGLKELHQSSLNTLISTYSLLNRDAFGQIISAHLKYRRKGANLSILDFK